MLSLLTSSYNDDQLQVGESATGWIKGTENRSWEGHRCSKTAGEGCWLSSSHSSTTVRAQANPFGLGLLPGANYDHPWKTSRGVEVSLVPGHRARKETFFLAWKPQLPLFFFSISTQEGGRKNSDQVAGLSVILVKQYCRSREWGPSPPSQVLGWLPSGGSHGEESP